MTDPSPRPADAGRHVCILIPAYNEQEVLPSLYERLLAVAGRCGPYAFTFLFVDDGSSDSTLAMIKELGAHDDRIAWVSLSRNFGKEAAMIAGLDAADAAAADAVIIIDADLQDPPELISQMLVAWELGYEDVYARRRTRAGETWMKKLTSKVFYQLLQHTTKVKLQIDTGDFRLLDRRCVQALRTFREHERYTKGMFSLIGFRKYELLYDRDPRAAGATKWNYGGLFDLAIDGITSFTTSPLRLASYVGVVVALVAFLQLCYIVVHTLFFNGHTSEVVLSTASLLFMGGVQLLCLGLIGEYVGRIFTETKNRPLYLVEEQRLPGAEAVIRPPMPVSPDQSGVQ